MKNLSVIPWLKSRIELRFRVHRFNKAGIFGVTLNNPIAAEAMAVSKTDPVAASFVRPAIVGRK